VVESLFRRFARTPPAWGDLVAGGAKSVWCVSDGRAGIERQTLAVAHALSELVPVDIKTIRINPHAPQVWLPPQLWPSPLSALSIDEKAQFREPWPDVWIGNGRRSIAYSLRAKRWSQGRALVVQLQDPRIDAGRFDLVVPPLHDKLDGPNVIATLGAPVWYTANQISAAQVQFSALVADERKKAVVILGGTSKRHRFTPARAHEIIADLRRIAQTGVQLLITSSRRTHIDIAKLFRRFAGEVSARFFADEAQDGPNPYLAWLSCADVALVTEDSTNMMTDAAFFGLPIHILRLEGGDNRFDAMHNAFIARGAARWHTGALEAWEYLPVRDALTVAKVIAARLP
jgi:uncharacterized protein